MNNKEEPKIEFQELENLIHNKTMNRLVSDARIALKSIDTAPPTLLFELKEKLKTFFLQELSNLGLDYKYTSQEGYRFVENNNLRNSEIYKTQKQYQFNEFVKKLEEKEREEKAEKVIDEILEVVPGFGIIPPKPVFPENSIRRENEVQNENEDSFFSFIKDSFQKWKNRDKSRVEVHDIGGGAKKKVYYNSHGKEYEPEPSCCPLPPIPPKDVGGKNLI